MATDNKSLLAYSIVLSLLLAALSAGCGGGAQTADAGTDGADAGLAGGDDGSGDAGDHSGADLGDGGAGDAADAAPDRHWQASTLLGEGGFFGVSAVGCPAVPALPAGGVAIAAHYADITPDGAEPTPAGRVYFFPRGTPPATVAEAALVLEPPDGAPGGGFGWALAPPCDFDGDGFLDLAVGNHLYSSATAPNSGRVVVFRGAAGEPWSGVRASYHGLPASLVRQSDSLGQVVLCADFDGDGYADLLAGGQNAGASDTGLAVIFHGSPAGLAAEADTILEPPHLVSRQYFGAAAVWEDFDGDGSRDLAIGGWGLVKGLLPSGPHTGGVFVYRGGEDWTQGPAWSLWPDGGEESQFGVPLAVAGSPGRRFLVAGASDYGEQKDGAVFVFRIGVADFMTRPPVNLLLPPAGYAGAGFGSSLAFVADYHGREAGALLVGIKYGDGPGGEYAPGVVAVYPLAADGEGFVAQPELLVAPQPQSGDGFGAAVVAIGDFDGDGLGDLLVGIPEHLEGDIYTGQQTGGVVWFH